MSPIPIRCSCCGADLPRFAPEGLCPACLLEAIDAPVSDFTHEDLTKEDLTTEQPLPDTLPRPDQELRPVPGQLFGPYRILRLLGRGGMGEVYEAEHLEQRRRVALKVLKQQLDGDDHRARFIREGQMAASINHPNSVYIFGSEEIAGTPVIAMELLSGGTLKDRVREDGPLPPTAAVDAILQVIAGLATAEAAGILHRDIKPANCFVGADGVVKIGDFGLSISTAARAETASPGSGGFQGTPQFASPEQLRGDTFDVRADIYAVGATLYFLLTGQAPFDADGDRAALIARIANERPAWSSAAQRVIHRDLAVVVNDCLAKRPGARPKTYAQLVGRLRPFSSARATPAPLGLRLAAAAYDWVIVGFTALFAALLTSVRTGNPPDSIIFGWVLVAVAATYSTVVVGVWSTSYGLHACGLQLVTNAGRRVRFARALLRSGIALTPLFLAVALRSTRVFTALPSAWAWAVAAQPLAVGVVLLFSTARSRNGYAGLHDILSGTRVVTRRPAVVSPATVKVAPATVVAPATRAPQPVVVQRGGPQAVPEQEAAPLRQIGPYDVGASIGATDIGEVFVAADPRLKRQVWVHVVPPDTAPVSALVRGLSRPGRLHWLDGQRGPSELSWDAYDASAGTPLLTIADSQPWTIARQCLLDLAREIKTGLEDGSLDALHFDRVWVMNDGHAKLLDFQAPGARPAAGATRRAPKASGALGPEGTAVSHVWIDQFAAQSFLHDVAGRLLGPAPVPPLPRSASSLLQTLNADEFRTIDEVIAVLERLATKPDRLSKRQRNMPIGLCTLCVFVGDSLVAHLLAHFFGVPVGQAMPRPVGRPNVSSLFYALVAPRALSYGTVGDVTWAVLAVLFAAVLAGGFWLRLFGIAVVTPDGTEASRLRAACRAAIAWSWVPAQIIASFHGGSILVLVIWLVRAAALFYATQSPQRGVQDLLAGTYLVPR
jgi:hypothetical protein